MGSDTIFPLLPSFWVCLWEGCAQPAFKENVLPVITLLGDKMGHPGENDPCQRWPPFLVLR